MMSRNDKIMILLRYLSYTIIFIISSNILTAFAFQSSLYSRSFTNRHSNLCHAISAHPNHGISEEGIPSIRPVVVIVAGATGYIGKAVVEESVKKNYSTLALVRSLDTLETPANKQLYGNSFDGAHLLQVQVTNSTDLQESISSFLKLQHIHSSTHDLYMVSCLASPIGTRKEAYAIDYQATLNLLHTAQHLKVHHFCLLSAFCVRHPLLQLQQAKLKMEAALQNQTSISWTIIRPTAFLKSISGQFESIQKGNSYVVFGDGAVTRCNPISQQDLADFMLTTMVDSKKHNQVYNIGGPDDPLTPKMLGEKMFASLGRSPKFTNAPTFVFDLVISFFQAMATWTHLESLEDSAEYARIGKYYAVEDMLTTRPDEKYGKITVQDHYNTITAQGQDPFTPIRATSVISHVLDSVPLVLVASVGILSYSILHPIQS